MLASLSVVLPIFALIFAGWFARRVGVFGATATRELNRFVVYLALPALLFDIVANAHWTQIWRPAFIGAYAAGAFIVFFGAIVVGHMGGLPLADAAVDGVSASYSNTGYIGFPLGLAAFGSVSLAPTLIATLLTVCLLFAVAIVLIEATSQKGANALRTIAKVSRALVLNPLLAAPCIAAAAHGAGLGIPAPAESFLKLLGAAASPCALVALGLFLADSRERPKSGSRAVVGLVAAKLVCHPLLTWIFASYVFGLPNELVRPAVLLAALPTGTGPFMLAEFYGRRASATASAILISTILSIASVSVYIAAAR